MIMPCTPLVQDKLDHPTAGRQGRPDAHQQARVHVAQVPPHVPALEHPRGGLDDVAEIPRVPVEVEDAATLSLAALEAHLAQVQALVVVPGLQGRKGAPVQALPGAVAALGKAGAEGLVEGLRLVGLMEGVIGVGRGVHYDGEGGGREGQEVEVSDADGLHGD